MLCFVMWNYMFRTAVNLTKATISYAAPKDSLTELSGRDIEQGANAIIKALNGKYRSPCGQLKDVHGDLTKVPYVENLPPVARRLLTNVEHVTRDIPGSQEVRRTMRHQTHAHRIAYGEPFFITFSPNEKDSALMLRLHRSRRSDPCHLAAPDLRRWGAIDAPALDEDFVSVPVDQLIDLLPTYEERQKLLARDPLACADGFRVLCRLALRHLFGMRGCPKCPDCNSCSAGCMDLFGSNAEPEGGIFGRVDAVYGSIECQKCGSLHLHVQVFVQRLHQHTPLRDILKMI